jgi:N-carbamoyl-L-amino-acid hydrolase
VIYALECARAIKEAASYPGGVDVAVFCDEEGHFGSFLGSRSFIGVLDEVEIDSARNVTTGVTLREALRTAGFEGRPRFIIDPSRYVGFFEAHIEQGRVLETAGKKIGIVNAIVGFWQYRIFVEGEQNHAGTTPMKLRRDAGLALIKLLNAIDAEFRAFAGAHTVWTTGRIILEPGARSIIPGQAEALFQFRDTDITTLDRLDKILGSLVNNANDEGPCKLALTRIGASQPAQMDEELVQFMDDSAEHIVPNLVVKMQSGAAHDSQYLATKLPTAMLFVPSINGVSHHWAENTSDDDIVTGAEVFARAISLALEAHAT